MTEHDQELDVEVFRGGDYGVKGSYNPADLDSLASEYNPSSHEAPVTVDHAQQGPAHGWVKRLRRFGDRLVATLWKVSPALRDWLRSGAYRKCSIELYRKFRATGRPYLKAVSFLGASAPEVKGLQPPVFAEAQSAPTTKLDQAVGEPITGVPAARDDSEWFRLDDTERVESKEPHGSDSPKLTPRPDVRIELDSAFDLLRRAGKFLPAWEAAGIRAFAEVLLSLDDRTIASPRNTGGGVDASTAASDHTPWQWFFEFLGSLPRQVDFVEYLPTGTEPTALPGGLDRSGGVPLPSPRATLCPRSLELHREVVRYQSEHPGVAYVEALHRVARA